MDRVSGAWVPVRALSSEGERPDVPHVGPFQTGSRSHRQLILEETEARRREVTWLRVSGAADRKAGLLVGPGVGSPSRLPEALCAAGPQARGTGLEGSAGT